MTARLNKEMDQEEYKNDEDSFKRWLDFFCADCESRQAAEDDALPLIPPFTRFIDHETEAECLSWCLQVLTSRKCPNVLACHLSRSTYLCMSALDQSPFYKQNSNEGLTEIDSHRYMRVVYQKLRSICEDWRDLLPPLPLQHLLPLVSCHAIKNTRRKMEDRHVVVSDVNAMLGFQDSEAESFYGVFDGHAGADAAIYACTHLCCNITRDDNHHSDISRALFNAHNLTDQRFIAKSKREALKSGTTCVSALIQGDQIHVAWLGDSQAILVRDGQSVVLTTSHKPERVDEKQRIEDLGGCVVWYGTWRVNGNIAVSRAIGDSGHKPYITSDPDTISVTMDGTEEYMVLACDGAWDTLSNDDIPKIVYDHLKYNDGDLTTVARSIVVAARDNGSADNITVVVVFFKTSLTVPPGCSTTTDGVVVRDEEDSEDYSPDFRRDDGSLLSSAATDDTSTGDQTTSDSFPESINSFSKEFKNVGNFYRDVPPVDNLVMSDSNNNVISSPKEDGSTGCVVTSGKHEVTHGEEAFSKMVNNIKLDAGLEDEPSGRHSTMLMGTESQRSFYYGNSQYMPTFNKKTWDQPRKLSIDFEIMTDKPPNQNNNNRSGQSKSAGPLTGTKKVGNWVNVAGLSDNANRDASRSASIWSYLASPQRTVCNYRLNQSLRKSQFSNLTPVSTNKNPLTTEVNSSHKKSTNKILSVNKKSSSNQNLNKKSSSNQNLNKNSAAYRNLNKTSSANQNNKTLSGRRMTSATDKIGAVLFGSEESMGDFVVNDQFKPTSKLRMVKLADPLHY